MIATCLRKEKSEAKGQQMMRDKANPSSRDDYVTTSLSSSRTWQACDDDDHHPNSLTT